MTPLDAGKGDAREASGIRLTLFAPAMLAEGLDARALPLKATAALAYLATANGQPVAREKLADLLWARNGPEQARQSLRQALVTLRRALRRPGGEAKLSDPVPQSLVLTGFAVDSVRFEALANCADPAGWAQALALYKAPLLADFPELGEPFDEWLTAERARLQNLASATLHKLALSALEAGEPEAAVAAAQRLLGFDNLREDSHRLLMRAYAASGRRSDALRHYAEAAALLKAELGVAPDAATAALAESIRAASAPALVEAQAASVAFAPPVLAPPAKPRWRFRLAGAGLALLLLGAAALGWWRMREAAEARPVYALNRLVPLTDTPESRSLADALTARLASGLGGIPYISLIAPGAGDARAAGYVISGTVQQGEAGAHVEAWITDPATGKVLASSRFDAPAEEPLAMQDEILGTVGHNLSIAINQSYFSHPLDTPQKQRAEALAKHAREDADHVESSSSAIELLEQAIALDPENIDISGRLATLLISEATNDLGDAKLEYLNRAHRILAQAVGNARWNRLISYAGCEYYRINGNLNNAISACKETLQILPWSARTAKELGYIYQLQGDFQDSLTTFSTSARLAKSGAIQWTWFYGAGLTSLLAGQNHEALGWLSKAIMLRSDAPAAHLLLIAAYHRLGDHPAAVREAQTARQLNPALTADALMANLFPENVTYNANFKKLILSLRDDIKSYRESEPQISGRYHE